MKSAFLIFAILTLSNGTANESDARLFNGRILNVVRNFRPFQAIRSRCASGNCSAPKASGFRVECNGNSCRMVPVK